MNHMLRPKTRVAVGTASVTGTIIVISVYYSQATEFLMRVEKLAHVAIPAALAVGLLYRIVKNIANGDE